MDFSDALVNIRLGRKVARSSWGLDGPYLFFVPGSSFPIEAHRPLGKASPELVGTTAHYRAHVDMRTPYGFVMAWTPNQEDMLTDDWFVKLSDHDVAAQDASGPDSGNTSGNTGA